MKILIGCEYSAIVREAFEKRGHDVTSCDLLPSEKPGKHYQGNIEDILGQGWDLLIAFPPCTYLAICGLHYLKTRPERTLQHKKAVEFFKMLYNCRIEKIVIENPIGWMNTNWKKPTQIIQPYYFGDDELKTTCLWLKNVPPLQYKLENDLFGEKTSADRPKPKGFVIRKTGKNKGKRYNYYFRQGKSAKERARFFPSIAHAMAEQWG